MRGQMRKIRDRHGISAHLSGKFAYLLMRELQKFVQNTQLIHQFKSGRVNRVAAKVAQEIRMLFENVYIHADLCKQVSQHNSGGASSADAASCTDYFAHRSIFLYVP